MLKRTHLALGFAVAFYFMPHIEFNGFLFTAVVLAASLLPDLESGFASPRRSKILTFVSMKWIFQKNKILHTYTILIVLTALVAVSFPRGAFPFFLGYSFHVFLDSFSPEGIRPFWPLKRKSVGTIAPGGKIDHLLFIVFTIVAVALFAKLLF